MPLDAFTSRLGVGQGRVERGVGEHAFILGDDEVGRWAELWPGDFVEVVQAIDVSDIDLVRMRLELRVPASLPIALTWDVILLLDAAEVARASGRSGHSRPMVDLAANVSKLFGTHELAIRLELVPT